MRRASWVMVGPPAPEHQWWCVLRRKGGAETVRATRWVARALLPPRLPALVPAQTDRNPQRDQQIRLELGIALPGLEGVEIRLGGEVHPEAGSNVGPEAEADHAT